MDQKELAEALGYIQTLNQRGFTVTVAPTDDAVYEKYIETFTPEDPISDGYVFKGRGGTSYTPILRWITEHIHDMDIVYAAVVIFTGGKGDNPPPDVFPSDIPVFWVVTNPFGKLSARHAERVIGRIPPPREGWEWKK